MYPYMNEDAAFERLKDLQREMEISRVLAGQWPTLGRLARNLGARAWWLGGLAMRRPPRRSPAPAHHAIEESAPASDAA
jgi:hypothetical protein